MSLGKSAPSLQAKGAGRRDRHLHKEVWRPVLNASILSRRAVEVAGKG